MLLMIVFYYQIKIATDNFFLPIKLNGIQKGELKLEYIH